jgi:hypothetical protein
MKTEHLSESALGWVSMSTSLAVLVINLVGVTIIVVSVAFAARYIKRQIEDVSAQYAEILAVVTDIREYKKAQVDVWKKAMEAHARGELEEHLKNLGPETLNNENLGPGALNDEETKQG